MKFTDPGLDGVITSTQVIDVFKNPSLKNNSYNEQVSAALWAQMVVSELNHKDPLTVYLKMPMGLTIRYDIFPINDVYQKSEKDYGLHLGEEWHVPTHFVKNCAHDMYQEIWKIQAAFGFLKRSKLLDVSKMLYVINTDKT